MSAGQQAQQVRHVPPEEEEAPFEVILGGDTYRLCGDGYYHIVTVNISRVMSRGRVLTQSRETLSKRAYKYENGSLYGIYTGATLRLREAEDVEDVEEETEESKAEEAEESKAEEAEETDEKWRGRFNRTMETIQHNGNIQDKLRQLSESSDEVNPDELPLALAVLADFDADVPFVSPVEENDSQKGESSSKTEESKEQAPTEEIPEDEPVLGQTRDGTVLIFENAAKALIHDAVVLGRATKETLELLRPLGKVLGTGGGFVLFKTKDGIVIALKTCGKILMGICDEFTTPESTTQVALLQTKEAALDAGKALLRLTGTFFEYMFSAGGGGGRDPDRYDEESDEESDEEEQHRVTRRHPQRNSRLSQERHVFSAGGGGGRDPARYDSSSSDEEEQHSVTRRHHPRNTGLSQERQLRKLDNQGGGRLYTTAVGQRGQEGQTHEERNNTQRAARIARAKARKRRLFEPQFKQFINNL
jgi:hypothetical protein